ncbi:IclR family transcriptional regulator [Verticiella sediminum]
MVAVMSTRARSRASGSFVRSTPGSQSLERGLALLRAFRVGGGALCNAELAARAGLPRPTVSRLTRSLVDAGFLAYDHGERGYRLTAVCLGLAQAYRSSERRLEVALPLMRGLAEGRRVNVGLAQSDGPDMIYLESVRLSRLGIFRRIVPGSRIPMSLTALGRAFLAGLPAGERKTMLRRLRQTHGAAWPSVQAEIDAAIRSVREVGLCRAEWQAGMTSLAVPLRAPDGVLYAINISFPEPLPHVEEATVAEYGRLLIALAAEVRAAWLRAEC